jgi:orotate phosphoribosyltransferase
MTENTKKEVSNEMAKSLLEIKAIKLSPTAPYTWASGWKSPIYCDNRISLSFPKVRRAGTKYLSDEIKSRYPDVETIAGVATAGIAQAALIAQELDLPMIYVRDKAKSHGMANQIEGYLPNKAKVVVIEDLISTGGSSLKAVDSLREAGAEVLGLAAIFTYGFDVAKQNFESKSVPYFTLSNYHDLLEQAVAMNYVKESDVEALNEWRESPSAWKSA